MPDNPTLFSAADPALGYLYQIRCALLWSLQRLKDHPTFEVSIETLDDVTFETGGMPAELLQTKLHKNKSANLTNASTDLWKTLRIWIAALDAGETSTDTMLYLVTTENAPDGTAAGYLKSNSTRNIEAALNNLNTTATTSVNTDNAAAYASYLAKPLDERRTLLKNVYIVDAAPDMADLDTLLEKEIFYAVDRAHQKTFLEYLEGWWFRRAINQLQSVDLMDRILSEEIETQMADLRDQFKQDSLPISDDLLHYELDDSTAEEHQDSLFVQQVRLATTNSTRIGAAIRDYYRAFEQRSRWLRQDLLFVGDLSQYEKSLKEEWELTFAAAEDELGMEASETEKTAAAHQMLKWVEQGDLNAKIKTGVTDTFITRGSLHMLANELKVGWHPEFKIRLEKLLEAN